VGAVSGHTFLPLWSGALAIGHRPALRKLKSFSAGGVTHVATVLSASEQAEKIGEAVRRAGLDWIWVDLGSTKSLPKRRKPEIIQALGELEAALKQGARIYLHCSAGIHRTGMIAAALLFHLGHGEQEVRAALDLLRPITARDMGEQRFDWARSFCPDPATSPL
jgi:protein-tyrosine phosphatase